MRIWRKKPDMYERLRKLPKTNVVPERVMFWPRCTDEYIPPPISLN